jgi:hypothetical protein
MAEIVWTEPVLANRDAMTDYISLGKMKVIVLWLLMVCPLFAQVSENAPKEFASLIELHSWLEEHKGFGQPESVEASLAGLHVLVAWNSPFSGRAGYYAYVYVESASEKRWRLVDSSFFERPEPLGFAYVDGRSKAVVYVGESGRTLKSVSLAELRFE